MWPLEGRQNNETDNWNISTTVIANISTLKLSSKVYICRPALEKMLQYMLRAMFYFQKGYTIGSALSVFLDFSHLENVTLSLVSIFAEPCLLAHSQNWSQKAPKLCLSLLRRDRACRMHPFQMELAALLTTPRSY